jgi:hypothetical protein
MLAGYQELTTIETIETPDATTYGVTTTSSREVARNRQCLGYHSGTDLSLKPVAVQRH